MEPFAVNTYFGSLVNYAVFIMSILVWTEHQRHLSSSGALRRVLDTTFETHMDGRNHDGIGREARPFTSIPIVFELL